jgi:hypothetical protein
MLNLPLWVQWTAAVVFTVTNLATVLWVLLVMWPHLRHGRRSADETSALIKELVEALRKKLDKPKITEIDIP